MFLKDKDAVLEYRVDWSAAMGPGGAIVESGWQVEPAEAGGLLAEGVGAAGGEAVVRLSGGIAGHLYVVGNRVRLADGSVDVRSLVVRVEER